ncbi:Fatty acid hydroxylase [Cordyceps fumosorosea ARSEF 2679]|uniref:Fatty acid hydroxylase n=1 Tax=Cordyceps fumosorosea (strain ARSEF 2679) TaxID=1081104 RepID=A0A167HJI4_CORFA|nr:Fatty acid hydroxylase [Cordyceps fumosorosea ARSEF 2679]OAA47986.1 Fatty acid hydroxylase [Cordyceps fumosorosea ARSEF 2679]
MDTFLGPFEEAVLHPVYGAIRSGLENTLCRDAGPSSPSGLSRTTLQGFCSPIQHSSFWQPDNSIRRLTNAFLYLWLSTTVSYLVLGAVLYRLNFDAAAAARDPKFRPGQVRGEISRSLVAITVMSLLTAPIVLAQAAGRARIYPLGAAPAWYEALQVVLFVAFNDTCVYWLHRLFHTPVLFRLMHKKHHQYMTPTPFSAFAFDPLEAMIMSLPIYAFSFVVPMSDAMQLLAFLAAYLWTFLLHDDSTQFHTVHHKNTNFNFGQYTTLWDRWGGTYVDADEFLSQPQYRKEKRSPRPAAASSADQYGSL